MQFIDFFPFVAGLPSDFRFSLAFIESTEKEMLHGTTFHDYSPQFISIFLGFFLAFFFSVKVWNLGRRTT